MEWEICREDEPHMWDEIVAATAEEAAELWVEKYEHDSCAVLVRRKGDIYPDTYQVDQRLIAKYTATKAMDK